MRLQQTRIRKRLFDSKRVRRFRREDTPTMYYFQDTNDRKGCWHEANLQVLT